MNEVQDPFKRFPKLYYFVKHWDCGPGWDPLLTELSEKLEGLIENLERLVGKGVGRDFSPCASQIKEKYGTLRFYMYSETDEMSELIEEYEDRSSSICELCGQKGTLQLKCSWRMTRCTECLKNENE